MGTKNTTNQVQVFFHCIKTLAGLTCQQGLSLLGRRVRCLWVEADPQSEGGDMVRGAGGVTPCWWLARQPPCKLNAFLCGLVVSLVSG